MVRIIRSNNGITSFGPLCGPGSKGSEGSVGKVDGAFGPEGSKGSKVSRSLRLQGLWWRLRRNYSLRYVPSPRPCGHTRIVCVGA